MPDVVITPAMFERSLARAEAGAADPAAGLFGPGSVSWRVNKEALVFLGAGRALLLQLAHPWVAAGVTRHSTTLADPIGRFHRTFGTVYAMLFGTREQASAAARGLFAIHERVRGELPDAVGPFAAGSPYLANAAEPLAWVQATLVDTALMVHDLLLPPLGAAEREAYHAESLRLGLLFGLAPEDQPRDWNAFRAWFNSMLRSGTLAVSPATRSFTTALMAGGGRAPRVPNWYRALTAALMPEELRSPFGLRFDAEDARLAARALRTARLVYPRLPAGLRRVGPYREAVERLAGRSPGRLTRLSNRLWIGRASLGASSR